MRWKWRLGIAAIGMVEVPFLLWISSVGQIPFDVVVYAGAALAVALLAILALRPLFFGMVGAWLAGAAGGTLYLMPYLPTTVALGLGTTLSTLACAIGGPLYFRTFRILLRRHA